MASKDPNLRNLTIKTGVLKRCSREKTSYEEEAKQQEAKVEKMKQDGKDEHDIRKQEEVLAESNMMVPDCQRRIQAAYIDLQNTVDVAADSPVAETEEYKKALDLLEANKQYS